MAKTPRAEHVCTACGAQSPRWLGRCPRCQEFGTLQAREPAAAARPGLRSSLAGTAPTTAARSIAAAVAGDGVAPPSRRATGLSEFDRVLGGGLVPGQVLLLSGEPGAGKSTLLLTVADAVARAGAGSVLYCSGEESVHQIALRARRVGATSPDLLVTDDSDLASILGHIEVHDSSQAGLALVVIDSVQTIASSAVDGRAGGVAQVMEVAQALTRVAKSRGVPICLVGQVTKESTVAGPRALEHTVDTTLELHGDPHTALRLLRAVKNRYGPADEVSCFEQTEGGLREVVDPSGLFRGASGAPVPGTCLTVTMEGRRPLVCEVQALVSPTRQPNPRRAVSGLDSARVPMLTAVTERDAGLRLQDSDLFTATVGGIRLRDPGADLALCLAIASAVAGRALRADLAAIGEVTLSGEVRSVPMLGLRVAEATRLGTQRLLVPAGTRARLDRDPGPTLVEVSSLREALFAVLPGGARPTRPEPPPSRPRRAGHPAGGDLGAGRGRLTALD